MKLTPIERTFEMDYGAPSPLIIANNHHLLVAFQGDADTLEDEHVICVSFSRPTKHQFGFPGDEVIFRHPYYQLGLRAAGFYELENSEWIAALREMERTHHQYDPDSWTKLKHYILTFHDNIFECVAESFTVLETKETLYQAGARLLLERF